MKKKLLIPLVVALVVVMVVVMWSPSLQLVRGQDTGPLNNVYKHNLDIELGRVAPNDKEQLLSSGIMYALLQSSGALGKRAASTQGNQQPPGQLNPPASATGGCPNRFVGGGNTGSPNIRVNQDCSLRRQAEEVVAINPTNSNNLIAGANDSRIGYNHCSYAWSFDGGKTWGDQTPPFWQFVLLDGHTSDACSDPSVAFDADGNAYITGIIFDVSSDANAIVVAKSNAGLGGWFYHSPASGPFQTYRTDVLGVVANDNDPNIAHDKEFIAADSHPASPKKNNVYVTWTRFASDTGAGLGFNSPIFFSQSTDGGATWSPGVEISGANPTACTAGSGEANPNVCDQDQGSDPFVGADGTVYVSFYNQNTPVASNQYMVVKCAPGNDCSTSAGWSAPVKITDEFGGQPRGANAATGCPSGRRCLPPNGYRVSDATFGTISVDNSGKLFFTFSDFRNGGGTCVGRATTATPPCDQDVFYSFSTDGGTTWSPVFDLTPAGSAQWMPWSEITNDGATLWVGYYDRQYGDCETTGCNDITLARVDNPTSASPSIKYIRLTTSSMPNLVTANNPIEAGFLGDYMWVTVDNKGRPLVDWADTRGLNGSVEEDIYFATYP
jgi:hypothetical protein